MSKKEITNNSTNRSELDIEKNNHLKTKIKLASKERELHDITKSSSFKLAKIIAKIKYFVLLPIMLVLTFHPRMRYRIAKNKKYTLRMYESENFKAPLKAPATCDTAVVIHLFYTDMIDTFCEKLNNLSSINYDLFISVPDSRIDSVSDVKDKCPEARVVIVPNCGRDVLPFVNVMKEIKQLGYKKVLKIHSKKSPHRNDGEKWRDKIVESLLPRDKVVLDKIITTLEKGDSSIIGPEGEYVSLLVNYDSTDHHMRRLLKIIYGDKAAREMKPRADEFGFFAGTMFWSRIDALWPVIEAVNTEDFEPELGQVDSTLAHALERLFTLCPELNENKIYEVGSSSLVEIDCHTTNIPAWSEVALNKN